MAKTNKDILNAIRNEASAEYKERVPEIKTREDEAEVYKITQDYPNVHNEFLQALTNKIFKSVVMNRVWNNPLVMLKKGEIPYGQGIEQIFVDIAEKKNFYNDHFTGSLSDADDLLKKQESDVSNQFVQRNFAYKYKASLSNQRIRQAFATPNGIQAMIDGQVASVMTAANFQEFNDMLGILNRSADGPSQTGFQQGGMGIVPKGIIYKMADADENDPASQNKGDASFLQKVCSYTDWNNDAKKEANMKLLVEKLRTVVGEMKFLSNKYNIARVNTFSNPEDLVLFTTPAVIAKLDVNVIAQAFNVSSTDVNVRIITVPESAFTDITSPKKWGTNGNKSNSHALPIAVLADKEAIQQYDTLIESGSFYNPDRLMTNMFVHRQGITASCAFANAVVFAAAE